MTANQDLADRAVSHGILIERLKNALERKLVGQLNDEVLSKLLRLIERRLSNISARGYDTSPASSARLASLMAAIDELVDTGYTVIRGQLMQTLREIAKTEAASQLKILRDVTPIKWEWKRPAPATLRAIVTARPMQGELLSDWYQALPRGTKTATKRAINLGIANGETYAQIVQRLKGTKALGYSDGILDRPRKELATMTRTAVQHTASHAREATFEGNEDIIKGVQWVATLDTRTCPICGALDGKQFPVSSGPTPPEHHNCRCTRVPVLKSWKELGLPLNEIPPGSRASMDGQVSGDMTFPQWLKRQSEERQIEALGATRAKLYRGNRVKFDAFTNDRNQLLTLEQLRAAEGIGA